jgi:hypothetical protein
MFSGFRRHKERNLRHLGLADGTYCTVPIIGVLEVQRTGGRSLSLRVGGGHRVLGGVPI